MRPNCRDLFTLRGPLLPGVLVVEELDEDAAHDGAGLEANLLGLLGLVPVGHRDALGRLVEEHADGLDEFDEVVAVARERAGPEDQSSLV